MPVNPSSSEPAPIALPKTSESNQLLRIRHSMSHVLAMAVQKLFPQAQVTIGPWTESGFYWYVTACIACSLLVYIAMPDTRRHSLIDQDQSRLAHDPK